MKAQEFIKEVDNSDRGMNKYGLAARNKDGKFYSYRHGKLTGTFNNIQDLQRHQHELIKDESAVQEDAQMDELKRWWRNYSKYEGLNGDKLPFGWYMQLVQTGVPTDSIEAGEARQAIADQNPKLDPNDAEGLAGSAKEIPGVDFDKADAPITNAMKQELADVMGVDAVGEEEITKAMKMLGVHTGMESVQEDAGLTDQQKQGLQAIAKKYKGREGYNGDFLPTGYLRANYYTSIGTDGVDGDEAEAYVKKHGYEDISDAEESDDNFWDKVEDPEHFPITSAMRTDLHKVLGDNMDNVYRQAVDYLDQLDESVSEDAGSLQNHNEELNRITKLAGLGEGASMLPYFKQDEKTWSFPDAWAKDEALDTPYMSNMSMRQFLDTLGYDSDFEQSPPVDAKEFIGRTTQWLQKNIDNPSKQIPTTVDRSGGGATMIGGGKPEGWDNRQVKHHNELARKILTKYPEVTHFGFN